MAGSTKQQASAAIPRIVDARKLVQRDQELSGIVPVDGLERLRSTVESVDGDVHAELVFGRDLNRHMVVEGKVSCDVQLLCQRCLQPMPESVEAKVHWGIVWSEEQGKLLPKDLDPVIQEGDELNLYQVLEDEILLNLPMVAYHEEECVPRDKFQFGDEPQGEEEQRENPFKVLEQLKGSSDKS
ncbi:nucleic acid-binding protein [Microbulbifer flavimaris]|uniref:Large ribosomal RNA subunit accumulation protein YceD n=1 Tax=Microbulbifer flavimaris TaxID=1781068 RepID=A0ABX4I2Y8_9GAMM|nr:MULTISPECIES: YceD family protein [Microbulbifer]KUJ84687.1 nucleic acid-binding protein [Microbulbifer sp. ZGT114]PCO06779.1 nucleic acid-binding protein [Microbulbifer flavimaris]